MGNLPSRRYHEVFRGRRQRYDGAQGPSKNRWSPRDDRPYAAILLQRLHAGALRAADWIQGHRRLVCLVGGPLLTLTLVAINQIVLLDFPNSGDEYVYLYQAETLAAGRLWNQAPPSPEIFALELHDSGTRPCLRQLPPGLAAGPRAGVDAPCPGVAGEPSAGHVDARTGLGPRDAVCTARARACWRRCWCSCRRSFSSTPRPTSRTPSAARCCWPRPGWPHGTIAPRRGCRSRSAC